MILKSTTSKELTIKLFKNTSVFFILYNSMIFIRKFFTDYLNTISIFQKYYIITIGTVLIRILCG